MVDKRDPLFRELDEEMRREQITKLWNEYGTYLIIAVVLLLVTILGYELWAARRAADAHAARARYQSVLELINQGKSDEAQQELRAIAGRGPPGYAPLAPLQIGTPAPQ